MEYKSQSTNSSHPRNLDAIRVPRDYPWKLFRALALDLRYYLTEIEFDRVEKIIRHRDLSAYTQLSEDWGLQSMATSDTCTLAVLRAKYLLSAFLKKYQFETDAKTRQVAAMKKFITAEIYCRRYNQCGYKALTQSEDRFVKDVFYDAQRWIEKVIGVDLPDAKKMTDRSRHGPGATTGTVKGFNSSYFKYAEWPYHCTVRASRIAIETIRSDERWLGALEDDYRTRYNIPKHMILDQRTFEANILSPVDFNKITFVPKDAHTERTIAIEPTLNVFLQLGVDGFIRQRLKRWSIDLDDQSKNQRLARRGSLDETSNTLVTLDLSMASDTISNTLVRELLPTAWYNYLMDLRSPEGVVGEKTFRYEKISSMGNGFTFALETLIFTALTYGVCKNRLGIVDFDNIAVYGDDIIVPKSIAVDLIAILNKSGFKLNLNKSFFEGPVRESCGADWFRGKPVRPIYLTTFPKGVKDLFCDYNRIKRHLQLRFGITDSNTTSLIMSWVPARFKNLIGPFSDEDFDSYIHSIRTDKIGWEKGMWQYSRLINRASTFKSGYGKFHLRKLMSSLNASPPTLNKWDTKRSNDGSNFDIQRGNMLSVAYSRSLTELWSEEYTELIA